MATNAHTSFSLHTHSPLSSTISSATTAARLVAGLEIGETDISIESVATYFGGNGYAPTQTTKNRIRHCIGVAAGLVAPKATYTLFPISSVVVGKEVTLEDRTRLSLPQCFTDSSARLLAVSIGTLGSGLEKHCRKLASGGDIYESTLLDAIGTAMLDLVGENICNTLEEIGKQYGLVTGSRFAPGIDGYPLEQQHQLFQMADNASVGVSLNTSAIMTPTKSISFFVVLTQTVSKSKTNNKCSLCRLRNCQFRRLPKKEYV